MRYTVSHSRFQPRLPPHHRRSSDNTPMPRSPERPVPRPKTRKGEGVLPSPRTFRFHGRNVSLPNIGRSPKMRLDAVSTPAAQGDRTCSRPPASSKRRTTPAPTPCPRPASLMSGLDGSTGVLKPSADPQSPPPHELRCSRLPLPRNTVANCHCRALNARAPHRRADPANPARQPPETGPPTAFRHRHFIEQPTACGAQTARLETDRLPKTLPGRSVPGTAPQPRTFHITLPFPPPSAENERWTSQLPPRSASPTIIPPRCRSPRYAEILVHVPVLHPGMRKPPPATGRGGNTGLWGTARDHRAVPCSRRGLSGTNSDGTERARVLPCTPPASTALPPAGVPGQGLQTSTRHA